MGGTLRLRQLEQENRRLRQLLASSMIEKHLSGTGSAPVPQPRVALWLATAFLAGAVIMGLELAGTRLFAPYFGYSIYVWSIVISVVMVALAAGYAFAGWLADRSPTDRPLYGAVLFSAIYQVVALFAATPVLRWLQYRSELTGPVVATLVIFALPVATLAATGPFVIRLLARSIDVGWTAGRVYSLATAGSVVGSVATSFYLIPTFGTRTTLRILCIVCAVLAAAGTTCRRASMLTALTVLALLRFAPGEQLLRGEIWRAESAHNLARVFRFGNYLGLALNDTRYYQTIRNLDSPWSGLVFDDFALGPLLVPARRLLVLGMGGGASIAATRAVVPEIEVDAVEIDAKVVEAATRFFGLAPDAKKLRIHIADARPWLARNQQTYDLVHVDLYQGGIYVPFYLDTLEFFRLVRARMSEEGLLMVNVYDPSPLRDILAPTGATLKNIFPSVLVKPRLDGNHVILAFPRRRSADSIRRKLQAVEGPEPLEQLAHAASLAIRELALPEPISPFTDDLAPVERITWRVLRGLSGGQPRFSGRK